MSAQTDAIIALLSETAQKDLYEALRDKVAPEASEPVPAELPKKLSKPCPVCGEILQITRTQPQAANRGLNVYYCRGVNPLCMCSGGIGMGESFPGELSALDMTEEDVKAAKTPVTLTRPVEYTDEEDEDYEEEDEEDEEIDSRAEEKKERTAVAGKSAEDILTKAIADMIEAMGLRH